MRTVRQIAMDLGVSSGEVLARLREMGLPATSEAAPVTPDVERSLGARIAPAEADTTRSLRPPPPPPPRPGATAPAGPPGDAAAPVPAGRPASSRVLAQLAELPLLVLLAFAIAVVIKTFLVQAFFIPSGSMYPTLHRGDRVLVEKLTYRLREPRSSDVVVFAKSVFGARAPDLPWYQDVRNFLRELLGLPTGAEQDYIKRIVATGGDTIRYSGKPRALVVNGVRIDEPYVKSGRDLYSPTLTERDCRRLAMRRGAGGCVVPEGEVFVMGDNRGNSEDSRVTGPIETDKIVGHAFVIIWPPGDFSGL
jgi:signal peptidase I